MPVRCPACDLPLPKPARWAGLTYCTPACHGGAAAVRRLRSGLHAAEVAGDTRSAQAERDRLVVTISRIRLQRARLLGRRPKPRVFAARLS